MTNPVDLTEDQLNVLLAPIRLGFNPQGKTYYCGGPLEEYPKTPVLAELAALGLLESVPPHHAHQDINLGECAYQLTSEGLKFVREMTLLG